MSKWNDLVAYYEEHYQVAWARCLQPGDNFSSATGKIESADSAERPGQR
jgi:hypothetical protein